MNNRAKRTLLDLNVVVNTHL